MTHALDFRFPINSTTVRAIKTTLNGLARRTGVALAAHIAPRWTLQTASRWFVTPPRHLAPAAETAFLASGQRQVLHTARGPLVTWQFGAADAPAIIASHGWGGRGGQFRAFAHELLQAGFQVWVFDHYGHGQSAGREATLIDFTAGLRCVHDTLVARGVQVEGYLGHSLGGAAIAVALAGRDGLPPLAGGGEAARVVLIAPPSSLQRYSRLFARYLGLPERIREAMQWRFEQRIGVRWQNFEFPDAGASLRAEALIIHDQEDRDVPIATGLAVARGWPGARFLRTHGLGHTRILRNARVIRDARDFMTGEVRFSPPPPLDEWHAFPGPAPLW